MDLGQAQAVLEMGLDRLALRLAGPPWVAVGMRRWLLERDDHRADALVGQTREAFLAAQPLVFSRLHVAPYGLRVEPELHRDALLGGPADPSS